MDLARFDQQIITDIIITGRVERFELPEVIELQNPSPGELKYMRKRRKPAVLRYHKSSKDSQFENWMLKELMLYTPFRSDDIPSFESRTAEIYRDKIDWIKAVKSKVMEHLESVEEAKYMVEQSTKEVDNEGIGSSLNPEHEQENAEAQLDGVSEHPDYLHLDTDGIIEEINEKTVTSLFKEIDVPKLPELCKATRNMDEFQMEILNIAIKYAKDIVKSRRVGNNPPLPVYLIGHGGAGAGKSTVIHLVAKWCHLILAKEGDDINCPYIIKTAFTGTAASNIDGQTLHTAFGFNFDNKHYSLSDKTRDEKRNLFKNLKIIIIDEVSMVKADMLYQLDLKLQELKERIGTPFGGVSILAFGDMLQLRPVLGAFAFEKPKNPDFHATFELNNRWQMFKVINLEINHRQGNDKEYAEMLNRIRVGCMTSDDIAKLRTRVRPKGHPDLRDVQLNIVPTRKACSNYNSEYINAVTGDEIILKATHYHSTQKDYKPFIDKKEGAIGTTSFIDEIRLKVGTKIILIHNVDTSDGLTNGQLGKLVSIIFTKDGHPDKLIVELQKIDAGIKNRKRNDGIAKRFPKAVTIERVSVNYSIRKKGGTIGSTATLVQFPIKLAHAITGHKIQGQTIVKPSTVGFDLISIFEEAQGYVMLSRVEELNQGFIIEDFDPRKLYPSQKALKELARMNAISVNQNPSPWNIQCRNSIKVLFLNCAGLKPHFEDFKLDKNVAKADIITIAETSILPKDNEDLFALQGYTHSFLKVGPGKGIGSYFKIDMFKTDKTLVMDRFQAAKFKNGKVDIIAIYRSHSLNSSNILQELTKLIDLKRTTFIVGDFNLCYKENANNRLIKGLEELGFKQLIHEPTHVRGRTIDHAYLLEEKRTMKIVIERYSPYYSDHDALCITFLE